MKRKSYSYSRFRNKQTIEAEKLKITGEYNNLYKNMLAKVYDSYIDFAFKLYDESSLGDEGSEYSLEKACITLNDVIYDMCRGSISNYIVEKDLDSCSRSEVQFEIFDLVFRAYMDAITSHYHEICKRYLVTNLKESTFAIFETECFKKLAFLDSNFLKFSLRRSKTLFDKVNSTSSYLNEIFVEENISYLAMQLKSRIYECAVTVLNEIHSSIEFSESDLDEAVDLLGNDKSTEKLNYVDDYRRLNKLAMDNGFKYVRSNGDHGIFKNGGDLVVIPQGRSVGKGLSLKIQKAINHTSSLRA